jgi:hypothetical protein
MSSALESQVGGNHYRAGGIQPVQYIEANQLGFLEGCVVKRVTRQRETLPFPEYLNAHGQFVYVIAPQDELALLAEVALVQGWRIVRFGRNGEMIMADVPNIAINKELLALAVRARNIEYTRALEAGEQRNEGEETRAAVEAVLEYIADISGWLREDRGETFLTIRVADHADLSCKAFRRAALKAALEKS